MAVEITKRGMKVDITKGNPGLSKIVVGLGWDTNRFGSQNFDLDVSVFALNAQGKCSNDKDIVFFNNLAHSSEAIIHSGDEQSGATEGDDETITVDFFKMPSTIKKIAFVVTIHNAEVFSQNFGMVSNSYVRVVDPITNRELIKFDLGEDFSSETSVLACEVYQHNGEWKFNAVGQGYVAGLGKFVQDYGLTVG